MYTFHWCVIAFPTHSLLHESISGFFVLFFVFFYLTYQVTSMNALLISVLILNVLAFGIRFVSFETTCAMLHISLVLDVMLMWTWCLMTHQVWKNGAPTFSHGFPSRVLRDSHSRIVLKYTDTWWAIESVHTRGWMLVADISTRGACACEFHLPPHAGDVRACTVCYTGSEWAHPPSRPSCIIFIMSKLALDCSCSGHTRTQKKKKKNIENIDASLRRDGNAHNSSPLLPWCLDIFIQPLCLSSIIHKLVNPLIADIVYYSWCMKEDE